MIAEVDKPRLGGFMPRRRKSKPTQRIEGHCILYADYFADDPLHNDVIFRCSFRMSKKLFSEYCRESEGDRLLQAEERHHQFVWFLHYSKVHNLPLDAYIWYA
jgi:hypothetical protein